MVFAGLIVVAGWVFLSNKGLLYTDYTTPWVESVLVAAEIDLDQVQIVEKDGTERWKISVPSVKKKDAILRALAKGLKARASSMDPGEEIQRNGRKYHIVELAKEDGSPLRLIFEVAKVRKPKANPRPKKSPPKTTTPNTSVAASPPSTVDRGADAPVRLSDPKRKRQIAIILDDIGHEPVESLNSVLDLSYPITFAVLPHLPYSKACAYYFHQNQYEVMLHMPMEPESYPKANPGEGAILSHHNDGEIRANLNKALQAVPYVSGVNNHMGSKITASRSLMRPVLDEVKSRNLFYIDSRTQSNTVAFKMAKDMGLRTGNRDVFLDSEQSYDFAVKQLKEAKRVADKQGTAIVIGHPYGSSLKALKDMMPGMNAEGYRFVFASELVKIHNGQL